MRKIIQIIILIIGIFIFKDVFALSPPQYNLQRMLEHSFGASPCVDISEVYMEGDEYVIYIKGCTKLVANGLFFILPTQYDFGGIKVRIEIQTSNGNPVEKPHPTVDPSIITKIAKENLYNVLKDNPYFIEIHEPTPHIRFLWPLWVEIQADVIQFWNDDLGDLNGYRHFVAAVVFQELTSDSLSVRFFTSVK